MSNNDKKVFARRRSKNPYLIRKPCQRWASKADARFKTAHATAKSRCLEYEKFKTRNKSKPASRDSAESSCWREAQRAKDMPVTKKLDRWLTIAKKRVSQIPARVFLAIRRWRDRVVIAIGRFVEFIGYHLAVGRLRALREMREARMASALPRKPAVQLTPGHGILATEEAEITAKQQEWIDNEVRFNAVFMTGTEEKEWFEERARRVAKLKHLHLKDKLANIGMNDDQIAAECDIPSDVARVLREEFDAEVMWKQSGSPTI